MTIDKAIELLTGFLQGPGALKVPDNLEAVKLGIEALKHYQGERERRGATKTMWLSGETTE